MCFVWLFVPVCPQQLQTALYSDLTSLGAGALDNILKRCPGHDALRKIKRDTDWHEKVIDPAGRSVTLNKPCCILDKVRRENEWMG